MNIDLSGKVALITGGSRGIGSAIVTVLAEAGADIAFTFVSHNVHAMQTNKVVKELGRNCLALKANVSKETNVNSVVKKTVKEFGKIDILVNNAGIWKYGEIGAMTEREWDETIDINLKGTFLFCNAIVPFMKKQMGGRIINISSTAGQRGEPFHSHYAASKGGMIAFTKAIAAELIPYNIIVNCVAPGWVETDMSKIELQKPESAREIKKTIPRGKVATPDEIASSVLFLASELSNNLIGSIISSNGGAVLSN